MIFSFNKEKSLKTAEKYAQSGKTNAAIDEYRKIVEYDPLDANVTNILGDLYVKVGRNEDAVKCFLKVADQWTESGSPMVVAAVLRKINKLEPSNGDVAAKLGEIYCKEKKFADARQLFIQAAESYRLKGHTQKALKVLKRIADLDPSNPALQWDLATSYEQLGFKNEAQAAYVVAGQEFTRKGQTDEALKSFEKALAVSPNSKEALSSMVEALVQKGELTKALEMLDDMLDKAPDDPDLLATLGRAYVRANMFEEAEAVLSRLVEVDPGRFDELMTVARAYIDSRKFDRAIAIVDRCSEEMIARRAKKTATALLKDILKRDPDNILALKRLADIYTLVKEKKNLVSTLNLLVESALRQGRNAEAATALKQLVAIEPAKSTHKQRLEKLGDPEIEQDPVVVAPPSSQRREAFPEGFESGPALMMWNREDHGQAPVGHRPGSSPEPAAAPARYAATSSTSADDGVDSFADYSTELLEEMVSQHPEFLAARIKLLEDLVAGQPEYLEGRLKLKQHYLDSNQPDKAAAQCLEMARVYERRGDTEKAKELVAEAYTIRPSVTSMLVQGGGPPAAPAPPPAPARIAPPKEAVDLRLFDRDFDREWRRAARDSRPITLLKLSIDAYEHYVEAYGSLSAEYLRERITQIVEQDLNRPGDCVSAFGGDEFMIILPDTDAQGAVLVADRLRRKAEALRIAHENFPPTNVVTVSVGVGTAIPTRKSQPETLIMTVDRALSDARSGGGNRIATQPVVT